MGSHPPPPPPPPGKTRKPQLTPSPQYIVGRRVDILQDATSMINRPGVVVPLYCDVTSKISLESIVSVVATDVGHLNLLVCNAGISGPQAPAPPAGPNPSLDAWREQQLSHDFDAFTQTFRVNATSVWYTAMAFLKLLDEGNKRGNVAPTTSQVVVTSSIAAFNKMAPGGYAYGPSKAAATQIAKQLSVVLPTWNIRANCICPGRGFPPILWSFGCGLTESGSSFPERNGGADCGGGGG
jgi:NAD(P)-dependent dehydrogenase (short-subunit alcohol dehydrogenase family)